MSEYTYIDKTSYVTESEWNGWKPIKQLQYLESLIGFEITNGKNLTLSWGSGCPKSSYSSSSNDLSTDPYIAVEGNIFKSIKFKASGSLALNQTINPTLVDNGKTIFLLTGILDWGEVSFIIQTNDIYQWKNGMNQVDELSSGLGFILDNNTQTYKVFSDDNRGIYFINTQNFKIQDKTICVYASEGASQKNDGNYTYGYDFNYGYAKGRNYYAWGKQQAQYIFLYSNIDSKITPTITIKNNEVIINNKSYAKPSNTKILVCRRSGSKITEQNIKYLDPKNRPSYGISAAAGLSMSTTAKLNLYEALTTIVPEYSWIFGEYTLEPKYYTAEIDTENGIYNSLNDLSYKESDPQYWQNLGFYVNKLESFEYTIKPQTKILEAEDGLRKSYSSVSIQSGWYDSAKEYCVPGSFNFKTFNIYNHNSTPMPEGSVFQIKENPQVYSFANKNNKTMYAYAGYSLNVSSSVPGIMPTTTLPLIQDPSNGQVSINGNTYPYHKTATNSDSEWNYQAYAYAATEFNGTSDAFWIFMVSKDFSLS